MITLNDVVFSYSKKVPLFEQLSLTLNPGHIYGLLGKNGAGKTTLLKLLCGLTFPMQGEIRAGKEIPGKRTPGFLSDLFFLPEDIFLPATTPMKLERLQSPFYPAFDLKGFRLLLNQFEVGYDRKHIKLSHGEQKKVMISFALACNTKYLFLDEPTNGLDIPSKETFRSMLAQAFSEDRIILLSTHQVRDLQNLIDQVLILEKGKIILDQPLDNATGSVYLETLFNTAVLG